MSSFIRSCIVATTLAALAGCDPLGDSAVGAEDEAVADTHESFEEWEAAVYQEPETGLYIVDGDIPIEGRDALRAFYEEHVQGGALSVGTELGEPEYWHDRQKLNLTYCVSPKFAGAYEHVVGAMRSATKVWEMAGHVRFVHKQSQDASCDSENEHVLFDVSPTSGAPYLARAFFPGQRRKYRNILIDSSSFGELGVLSLTGILRHELGHTLGFRHEHTRPESGTCFEDHNWQALTAYDAASVMHYPHCNGTQTGDLVLTSLDRQGMASLYGPPAISRH